MAELVRQILQERKLWAAIVVSDIRCDRELVHEPTHLVGPLELALAARRDDAERSLPSAVTDTLPTMRKGPVASVSQASGSRITRPPDQRGGLR